LVKQNQNKNLAKRGSYFLIFYSAGVSVGVSGVSVGVSGVSVGVSGVSAGDSGFTAGVSS
jgi:hypothetical protein